MWDRWQQGESLKHIAQLFDRNHSSILGILAQTGGIRPAPRKRSRLALIRNVKRNSDGARRVSFLQFHGRWKCGGTVD